MYTTIDVHVHDEDTRIEVNETQSGIALFDASTNSPRVNLFLGTTPNEIKYNARLMIAALNELRQSFPVGVEKLDEAAR